MSEYSVKEVANLFGKHEETIKRWLRSGKFPNAYIKSDKEGWRIPEENLMISSSESIINPLTPTKQIKQTNYDEKELIHLAYQAVTLTVPTNEILQILSTVGIKRTLEILFIMQQSSKKVKNPEGFIRMAIRENWSPSTVSVKIQKKKSKGLVDLTQQDYINKRYKEEGNFERNLPFYNWLED
ncbi:helix-turn-helix domain-containing protein [Bacillaceae bacterium CLA-AA-H227]|uniref:Helix-turn-helix domain-containing protein n=1 Tax=Robertmurraya yapensis (ex Hitch et al 2024) TaxID=3133160 RepID=A0ACC6SFM1_9BACI